MNITRSSIGSGGRLIRQKNKSALLAAIATSSTAAAASSFITASSHSRKPSSSSLPIALDFISKRYKYDNAHDENSRDIMTALASWRLSDYSRRNNNTTTIISNAKRSFSSNSNSSSSSDDDQNNTATSQPTNNDNTVTTLWQPNQTTLTFTKMLNNNTNVASGRPSSTNTNNHNCKEIIQAYAQCVITKQNEGVLTKGVCEKEYNALMDCFRAARLA